MVGHQEKGKPVRRENRLHHELLVAYRTMDGFLTDWAVNISRGGIFINTAKPLPVGTEVRLIISLPDTSFPFDLTGRVARVHEFANADNNVPGMAVEFLDVDAEKRQHLEHFVERLRQEMPVAQYVQHVAKR